MNLVKANRFGLVTELDGKEAYVKGIIKTEEGRCIALEYTHNRFKMALWEDLEDVIELKMLLGLAFDEPQDFDFVVVPINEE